MSLTMMGKKHLTGLFPGHNINVINHDGKETFDGAFTQLKNKCKESKDQKRLGECLTSLGIKEVFSCVLLSRLV